MLRNPDYKGVNIVEGDGAEIFRLISGDPNIYEGGWDTPRHMKDAVIKAIEDGYNMYPIKKLEYKVTLTDIEAPGVWDHRGSKRERNQDSVSGPPIGPQHVEHRESRTLKPISSPAAHPAFILYSDPPYHE